MSMVHDLSLRRPSPRQATNVSLDRNTLADARGLGINVSQACERGLVETISKVRAERWRDENRAAILSSNAYVDANGLPLAGQRLF